MPLVSRLFLFVIFPLFVIYVYVTLLPLPAILGLIVIYIAAFFLPNFTITVRPLLALLVLALVVTAGYIGYYAAEPQNWETGPEVLRWIAALQNWDLLPKNFWKMVAGAVSAFLVLVSAWAGNIFSGEYLVTKET